MEETDLKQIHGRAWAIEMAPGDMEMGETGGGLRTEDRGRTSIEVRFKLVSTLREEILGRIQGVPSVETIRRGIFAQDLGDNMLENITGQITVLVWMLIEGVTIQIQEEMILTEEGLARGG
jgi:hypothetical protein